MTGRNESTPPSPNQGENVAVKARFEPNDLIAGRYRVIGSWGSGRLDEAYQVDDLERDEGVVLKVLRRSRKPLRPSRALIANFKRLTGLRHRNVARVHELSVHVVPDAVRGNESVLFVTSELVQGETLGSFVRRSRPLDPELARSLIDGICAGLAEAHRKRIVHGNLSSAAIVICPDGESKRPVLTDFTFAASSDDLPGGSIGSPVYKAPETIVGRPVDRMSDVFSLGTVFYEILSGRIPFTGGNLLALDFRRLEEEPRPLREFAEDVDPRLESVIARCLSRSPEDRYANAGDVRKAILGVESWTPRTRRNVSTLSAAAALVAVMLGGSALLDRVSVMEQNRWATEGMASYRPSFAVLDLAPLTPDTEPWLVVALSELIRLDFAQNESLRIAEDSMVRELCGSTPRIGVPGKDVTARLRSLFDVETILVGTCAVDRTGDVPAVAVDVCLVDARSGETLAAAFERGSPESLPELAARAASRLRTSIGIADAEPASARWDPDAVRPWAEGVLLERRHHPRDALGRFEEAARLQPGNPQIQDALTLVWSEIGHIPRAADAAQRAVDLSPLDQSEQTLQREANLAMLEGKLSNAIELREKLARRFPDRIVHAHVLIDTLLNAGATNAAGEEIRRLRTTRAAIDPRIEIMDARLHSRLGRFGMARGHADRAAILAEQTDCDGIRAEALMERAWAEAGDGNATGAMESLAMAEEILTRSSLSSGLTRLDFIRANLLQREGELDATFETHSRLRDHYLARGQEQRYAAVTASQAAIRSLQGRHGEAIVLLEEAIRRFGELEDDHNLVRSLGASGGVFLSLGRLSDARDGFTAAVRIAEENDLRAWEGFARTGLARVAVERLDLDQAEKQLGMAAARFREISLDVTTAGGDIVESEIDLLRGDPQKARNRLAKEPADREGGSDRERGAEVNLTLASVALWSGDSRGALTLATKSAAHYASARNLDGEVDSLTVALTAVSRLADEERRAAIERRLEALLPELESPLRVLRARLALAWSLDAPRARAERLSVERRSAEMGLALVRLEAVHALSQSGEPSERERWRTELAALVRESGARGFLDRPASTR